MDRLADGMMILEFSHATLMGSLLHIAARDGTIPVSGYAEIMSKGAGVGIRDKFTGRNVLIWTLLYSMKMRKR